MTCGNTYQYTTTTSWNWFRGPIFCLIVPLVLSVESTKKPSLWEPGSLTSGQNNSPKHCAIDGDRTRITRVIGGNTHHYTTMTSWNWVRGPMFFLTVPLVWRQTRSLGTWVVALGMLQNSSPTKCTIAGDPTRVSRVTSGNAHHCTTTTS